MHDSYLLTYLLTYYIMHCVCISADDDDFNEGLILPPLVIQLRKILDQYSDETQIFKVIHCCIDIDMIVNSEHF